MSREIHPLSLVVLRVLTLFLAQLRYLMLMLSKLRDCDKFCDKSAPDPLSRPCDLLSKARNAERIGSGLQRDREWIRTRSPPNLLLKSCDLSGPIRGSESQNRSTPDPLPICSRSAPVAIRSQNSCDLSKCSLLANLLDLLKLLKVLRVHISYYRQ